jgi:hypothetical protein
MGVGRANFAFKQDGTLFNLEEAVYSNDRDKNLMLKKNNIRLRSKKFINFPQMQAMYIINFKIFTAISILFKKQLQFPNKTLNFKTKYFFNIFLINFLVNKMYFPRKLHVLKKFFSKFNDTSDSTLRKIPKPKDRYKKLFVPFYLITKLGGSRLFKRAQGNLFPKHIFVDKPVNTRKKRDKVMLKKKFSKIFLIRFLRKLK